jgi:hypothetical protein
MVDLKSRFEVHGLFLFCDFLLYKTRKLFVKKSRDSANKARFAATQLPYNQHYNNY